MTSKIASFAAFEKILRILAVAGVFLCLSAEGPGLRTFTSKENKFSIAYPDNFETLPLDSPEIVFLIRDKKYLFPTFNILVLPGPYDLSQADTKHADSILDSYKLVGITDALPVKWFRFKIGDQNAFNMELKYKNQGKDLTSSVTITTASDRHYILTYIDLTSEWERNKDYRARIIGSFTILERSLLPSAPPAPHSTGGGFSIIWVLLPLAIPAVHYLLKKRKRR